MDRRKFLAGVGTTSIGGIAIIGSGAFDQVEAQRRATIEVARDPHAYLGMDECPDTEHEGFVFIDEQGHLEINLSTEDAGGGPVPGSTISQFDDVFQLCNYGKDEIRLWIQSEDREDLDPDHDDQIVIFYVVDETGERHRISAENEVEALDHGWFITLPVGECECVGIQTDARGLSEVQLLTEDEIVIHADTDFEADD